jgi:hypothetical protein
MQVSKMNFFRAPPLSGFHKTLQSGFAFWLPQRGNLQHFQLILQQGCVPLPPSAGEERVLSRKLKWNCYKIGI